MTRKTGFIFSAVQCVLVVAGALHAQPTVWVVDGSRCILQDGAAGSATMIELYAAKGEYEPFQVVVRAPAGGLTSVTVSVSDLTSTSGSTISKSSIALYREYYIYDSGTSTAQPNPSMGAGYYPDGLIPFADPITGAELSGATLDAQPFTVAAGKNQPVWADLFVPRDAQAGEYTGAATVTSTQGSKTVSVKLHVWNFELPLKMAYKADGSVWSDSSREALLELLRNRVAPRSLKNLSWQDEFVDQYGMQTVSIGFGTGIDIGDCNAGPVTMPGPPSVSAIADKVAQYRSDLTRYVYIADEVGPCLDDPGFTEGLQAYAKAVQDGGAVPFLTIRPLSSVWIPGPYIWCMSITAFNGSNDALFKKAHDAGQETWTYHTSIFTNGMPKWVVDAPPMNMRMHVGFMSQELGISGMVFWRVDNFASGDQWAVANRHGDGLFTYPGSVAGVKGVIANSRLKHFRDGFEDYEYVNLLKKADQESWAMDKVKSIVTSVTDWTKDMDALLAVRKELGEKLDGLNVPTINFGDRRMERLPVVFRSCAGRVKVSAPSLSKVEVFDLRGNLVAVVKVGGRIDSRDIVVDDLPAGAFLVRIDANGRPVTGGFVRF